MANSFDDDERSVDKSRPIDLYVISTPTVTYRLTSYVVDVTYQGEVYTATTMDRGPQQVAQDLTGREFMVYLPITHPIVQRYAAFGIPEQEVLITQYRLQARSGIAEREAAGAAQSMTLDGHVAALRVPSITDDAMKVRLPLVRAQTSCNHMLYDAQCRISRGAFTVNAQIVSISATSIVVTDAGGLTFAAFGEVVHNATLERRQILAQTSSTTLLINIPFVGASIGDLVTIFAGCDHSAATCLSKFNNIVNFGGMPHMNGNTNPWAPGGLGIIVQH